MTLEQLDAYGMALVHNAESLIDDAEVLIAAARYARAYALCTLALEEGHKPPIAWFLMSQLIDGVQPDWALLDLVGASHTHKLRLAVASHFAMSLMSPEWLTKPDTSTLKAMVNKAEPYVRALNEKALRGIVWVI